MDSKIRVAPPPLRYGFLVNPIAGMGGAVGLHGTDGSERLKEARALGAVAHAPQRAEQALRSMIDVRDLVVLVTGSGQLGDDVASRLGFVTQPIRADRSPIPSAADTRHAVAQMLECGIDLFIFVGGDGTARDVLAVVGDRVPVVGVPSGVKMHSGVFAKSSRAAGDVAVAFARSGRAAQSVTRAEVVDREDLDGRVGPVTLFGELLVPRQPARILSAKSSRTVDAANIDALCAYFIESMEPGRLYVLGPGGTIDGVRRKLKIAPQPLSVTAVRDRECVGDNLSEAEILALIEKSVATSLVVGVIGGQGSLLGRGNQQISARVIRAAGLENISVLATEAKLLALNPHELVVDTGDEVLDQELHGFRPVQVAPGRSILYPVTS